MSARFLRRAIAALSLATLATSCVMDKAPRGLRRTPDGPGATVRYDLGHRPLPDIPLPMDTATWPDPTSRTGLRVNASLLAPTSVERQARERFSRIEGWGTFAPLSVSFDLDRSDAEYSGLRPAIDAALDLDNIARRHQGDDYDFSDDAVYLVDLATGVPVPLDMGNGNFDYTLKKLDKYWANDTRITERNLLFDTIDETNGGTILDYAPELDTDFDGTLDVPNLLDPFSCPAPSLARCDESGHAECCDEQNHPDYGSAECLEKRRVRDRCIADGLLTFYERETDTLILRPLLPLDEMKRYAVVVTDRTLDAKGHPVRSPFEFVYHAAQEAGATRVLQIVDDARLAAYFGDIAGTGLEHVSFLWTFTTQPTVDDLKRLRDGLYGQGVFSRFASEFPATFELSRAVGLTAGMGQGATEEAALAWADSEFGKAAGCADKIDNLYVLSYDDFRDHMERLMVEGFDVDPGPGLGLLMKSFDHVDKLVIGTFKTPFLVEGGPKNTDPNAAMNVNFATGEAEQHEDTVQFWLIIPKETEQFKQPFDVNIYGHGYTGYFIEQVLYAGNLAQHGLATIGINAVNHGLVFDNPASKLAARAVLEGSCVGPFYDALTGVRARDLDNDGYPDSGGDFWTSYLFHTRDVVRQSILDHIQLVRILRNFGAASGMLCRNDETGWAEPASQACDVDRDGKAEVAGDFDADGTADVGGPDAHYGTWGESLGGILSAIHGSIDAYVTAAAPGSGGGGLTDIGARSFQGGVIEAVLLRLWGPLLATMPASERRACEPSSKDRHLCTLCDAEAGELTLRWVMPDVNGTGELEIACLSPDEIADTTVYVRNLSNDEMRCGRVDDGRFRVGLPSTVGDSVQIEFYPGKDLVQSYASCVPKPGLPQPKLVIDRWGKGRFGSGAVNTMETETCAAPSCNTFQGHFFGEGSPLTAPAEGLAQVRQTPSFRRFMALAQIALEPGDPVSFAPYYSIKTMTDPFGKAIDPHAVLTLNTIGDMNVPLNSGIAFARATGALPFLRPEHATKFPELADYATPGALYAALGNKTPNQDLIDKHVIEGITALARHPAGPECELSANAAGEDATWSNQDGAVAQCFPLGCTAESEADSTTRVCYSGSYCDLETGRCRPHPLGKQRCDEALFDVEDLDEGEGRIFEQSSAVPHRLARYTQAVAVALGSANLDEVWAPRLLGVPFGADEAWKPEPGRRVTGLLDAYIVPEGEHTFVNGEPCEGWDKGQYLTNLTARFFMSDGHDVYYLSHPTTHHCLEGDAADCGYLDP